LARMGKTKMQTKFHRETRREQISKETNIKRPKS
jgi:hypothetical protein